MTHVSLIPRPPMRLGMRLLLYGRVHGNRQHLAYDVPSVSRPVFAFEPIIV